MGSGGGVLSEGVRSKAVTGPGFQYLTEKWGDFHINMLTDEEVS